MHLLDLQPVTGAELGPFLGVSSAASVEGLDGGFGSGQNSPSGVGSLELAVRAGLGLEGVMSESGDGLVWTSTIENATHNRTGAKLEKEVEA